MSQSLRNTLPLVVLCLGSFAFVGCNRGSSPEGSSEIRADPDGGHGHDDDHGDSAHDDDHAGHDHGPGAGDDDHAGHDHAAHGPNGGHVINLSGGGHAEWAHDDEEDLLTVYAEGMVNKVEMKTDIDGTETIYEFESADVDGKLVYQLNSAELLTAIKMGDPVKTRLVITTEDGELSGSVEHHSH